MDNRETTLEARRRFVTLLGGGAVMMPLLGLAGCGGDEEARGPAASSEGTSSAEGSTQTTGGQATSDKTSEPSATREPAEKTSSTDGAQPGSKPKVSESDSQAKNLAYVHDADDVIASEQPRYQAGQQCSNCQLYLGTADDEWAGCPLFTGKLVKGTGWCNAYAPKPG